MFYPRTKTDLAVSSFYSSIGMIQEEHTKLIKRLKLAKISKWRLRFAQARAIQKSLS